MAIETGPPDESYEDNVEFLIDSLPEYMENDTTSGNWKLFSSIGDQFDNFENNLQSVSRSAVLQQAETIEQLDKHAQFVGLSHNEGEQIEHYRARIFAQYQLSTAEGTVGDLLNSAASILQVDSDVLAYQEVKAPATAQIVIPRSAVNDLQLQPSEVQGILNNLTAAGHVLLVVLKGTFVHVSPETYNNRSDWSGYNDGYDGLDSNGNPKQNVDSGTYAEILN